MLDEKTKVKIKESPPWKIRQTFPQFEDADRLRKSINAEPGFQAKVHRKASGRFVVKTRPIHQPQG